MDFGRILYLINTVNSIHEISYPKDGMVHYISELCLASFDVTSVIYYFENSTNISSILEESIRTVGFSVLRFKVENVRGKKERFDYKDGYIVASNNIQFLKDIFTRDSELNSTKFEFTNHKRILIIFEGDYDFNVYPFNYAVALQGLDIITISIYDKQIITKSLQREKELSHYYMGNNSYWINRKHFNYSWKPNFKLPNQTNQLEISGFNCVPHIYIDNVTKIPHSGTDFKIVKAILGKYPLSFVNNPFCPVGHSPFVEIINIITRGAADIGLCAQYQSSANLRSELDFTYPYSIVCATFLVPKSKPAIGFLFIFTPFSLSLWGLVIVTILSVSISLKLVSSFNINQRNYYKNYISTLLDVLRVYTMSSLPKFPDISLYILRFLITLWFTNCVLINTGYSAGYTSALTKPQLSKSINTLQDMIDMEIGWGGFDEVTKNYYSKSAKKILKNLTQYFKLEANYSERNRRIQEGRYAVLVERLSNNYLSGTKILSRYAKMHLKVLNECTGKYPIVILLRKNSPFTAELNRGIAKLIEHGFINYWYDLAAYEDKQSYMKNFYMTVRVTETYSPLKVNKLLGATCMLLVGYVVGGMVFVAELVYYRRNCRIVRV